MDRCYVSKSLKERTFIYGNLTQRRPFQKRERKALATICLSLGDEQLSLVRTATTAKEAWSKLESHFEVKSLANELFLRKKYFTMSMGVDDSMSKHINKMKELVSQLEAVGASITEDDQVATLLCSLPESYTSLITALESRADNLTLEFVTARLLHEEHKRKENSLTSHTGVKVLLSKHDRTNQKSFKPKRKGKCHNCGIPGHWARACRKPKKEKPKEGKKKQYIKNNTWTCVKAVKLLIVAGYLKSSTKQTDR